MVLGESIKRHRRANCFKSSQRYMYAMRYLLYLVQSGEEGQRDRGRWAGTVGDEEGCIAAADG